MSTTMIVYNEKHSVYNKTQFFVTVFIFKHSQLSILTRIMVDIEYMVNTILSTVSLFDKYSNENNMNH